MMDNPRAPADAYFEMVALLGEERLFTRAPQMGREVAIAGRDGVVTQWEITDAEAMWLRPQVLSNPNLRWVSERRYVRADK